MNFEKSHETQFQESAEHQFAVRQRTKKFEGYALPLQNFRGIWEISTSKITCNFSLSDPAPVKEFDVAR